MEKNLNTGKAILLKQAALIIITILIMGKGTTYAQWLGGPASADSIFRPGAVAIGFSEAPDMGGYKLLVNGSIKTKEINVTTNGWPDFVFGKEYKLMPLNELENFITENKHLPGIPTEEEVTNNGVSVGDMQSKLLQKIEELTLYLIEENKKFEEQSEMLKELKAEDDNTIQKEN